jgi:hypothetical protein
MVGMVGRVGRVGMVRATSVAMVAASRRRGVVAVAPEKARENATGELDE